MSQLLFLDTERIRLSLFPQHSGHGPTIRERFNTYRFADYKEKVIDLLMRVTTVSLRTVAVVESMRKIIR